MTLKQSTDVEEKQEAFLPANNSIYTDTATSVIQSNTCQPTLAQYEAPIIIPKI